jgi:large subunit ribosomal protein L24
MRAVAEKRKLKSKLRVGDQVLVVAGKDKGKKGSVLKLVAYKPKKGKSATGFKVVVEGINLATNYVKSTQERAGEIIRKEAPLDASNVRILNPKTSKMDKIGFKILEDGKKVRIFKSNGEVVGE